jgi:DNA-binding CsgD family transcriptional regulator
MTSGYEGLTEKEKETLRLLLGGHDAKSMARQLGLSVHTIHERLREARRKMAVSSSREAARQLREIEAQPPESFVDKPLGDATPPKLAEEAGEPTTSDGERRRFGWLAGGFAMTISLALLALSALSGSGQPPSAPASTGVAVVPTPASEMAAVDAARQFLAKLDQEDWRGTWQATHKSFQLLNTVEWWAKASQQVRGTVGTPLSRELARVDFTAAPPNGYWTVVFKARYSTKADVTETLQLASQDGGWKVAAISVD